MRDAIVATSRYNVTTIPAVQYNGWINPRHAAAQCVVLINSLQHHQLKIINWTSGVEESLPAALERRRRPRVASRRRFGDADRRRGQCTFILNAERIVCFPLAASLPSASSGEPCRVHDVDTTYVMREEKTWSRFYYASQHSSSKRKVSA